MKNKNEIYFDLIVSKMFYQLCHAFNLDPERFKYISDMSKHMIKASDDGTKYFWKWFNETGCEKIKYIKTNGLPDTEEIEEMLDYRMLLLEMDTNLEFNHIDDFDSLFITFADTLEHAYNASWIKQYQ